MREMWAKFRGVENRVLDFLVKHCLSLLVIAVTVIGLVIRFKLLRFESLDYQLYLGPWSEDLKVGGGLKALANFPGDYNAPYMTILALLTYIPIRALYTIKAVSVLFEIILAAAVAYLVYILANEKYKKYYATFAYIVTFMLPQVLLNGAYWGQCDAMYTSFCVLALIMLLKERYTLAFVMLGLAFAFKLQFIIILPIFIVYYVVKRRFSILNFLLIPVVDLVLCLPAIIAGKPIIDCLTVYFRQTQTYADSMSMNYINFWSIFNADPNFWNFAGTLLTFAICAVALVWIVYNRVQLTHEAIIALTVWFAIILTFFLPGMHERYLFAGEILAVAYYILYRKNGFIVLLINAYALVTYSRYLTGWTTLDYSLLGLVELFAIAWFTKKLFSELLNNRASQRRLSANY